MFVSIKKIPNVLTRKLKIKLIIHLIFSFFIPFLELLSIGSIGTLVLFVIDLENYLHIIPNFIVENYLINLNKIQIIYFLSAVMLIAIILKNVFLLYYHYFENTLRRKISSYHSKLLYDKFINQSYLNHTLMDSADIQNNILYQSQKCSDFVFYSMMFIKESLIAIILIITLLLVNIKASSFLLILSLFISLIFYLFSGKKTKNIGEKAKQKESELIQIVKNTFEGFKIIILYGKKNFFGEKFKNTILSKYKYEVWHQTIQKIPRLCFEIIFALTIISILINYIKVDNDIKKLLPFLVFLSLISMRLLPIFVNLNVIFSNLKYFEKPVEDLVNILLKNGKIEFAKKVKENTVDQKYENIKYIDVKNLSFNYPAGNLRILKDISFQLKNNKIYAIAGKTGAGKSTLLDLLTGVLKPSNGKIFVNNNLDINNNIQNWQNNVGYVPQDNFLLNDSILKNICFGDDDIDINKFNKTIKQAELSEFIKNLPQKENTFVGDRGLRISGGQKQRLGLARALYKEKIFLAFDEATSAVDTKTEYNILNTLHKIKQNKIIVIIAHRETTIKLCDEVLYLSEGKLLTE